MEVKLSGEADMAVFNKLDVELIEHPKWKPGTNMLFDFRKLDMSKTHTRDLSTSTEFVATLSEKFGNGRLACVVAKTVDYGLARAWELMTADEVSFQTKTFRSLEEAQEWLDSK